MTTCRSFWITPHVAMKQGRSALDRRTSRHAGYAASQRARKRVEEVFGWLKTVGGGGSCVTAGWPATASGRRWPWRHTTSCAWPSSCPRHHLLGRSPCLLRMKHPNRRRRRPDQGQPGAPLPPNRRPTDASMPAPARSLDPKLTFFISLLSVVGNVALRLAGPPFQAWSWRNESRIMHEGEVNGLLAQLCRDCNMTVGVERRNWI